MMRKSLLLAGCIASFCAWGSCDKPAEVAPSSAVQMPDYKAAVADEAPDPQEAAMQTAWRNYQDSVFDALSHSPNPRDWALATLTVALKFDPRDFNQSTHRDLLERAMHAAPDDVLVLWIAMNNGITHDAALRALRELESDNAAVWNEDLVAGAKRNDDAAIDAALRKMSAARRFDLHFSDVLKAMLGVYLRNPLPEDYFASASTEEKALGKEGLPYIQAMSVATIVAIPGFQHLVNACMINPTSGKNSARAADCAAIGRLMMTHGNTLIVNRLGGSVLRVSHTYTDEDLQLARDIDWVYQHQMKVLPDSTDEASAKNLMAQFHDWADTGNEVEAMRRALVRHGIAPTPPQDWNDTLSVFSTERQRSDAEREKNAAK